MVLGFVTALLLLLTGATLFFLKRGGKGIHIAHKVFGVGALVACAAHLLSVLSLWQLRPLSVWAAGVVAMILLALAILCPIVKRGKWRGWHKGFAALLAAVVVGHVALDFVAMEDYQKKVAAIKIPNLDISRVADGAYLGSYDVEFIIAKVRVTVESGAITGIDIVEHGNDRGKAAEAITADMIRQQRVNVDTVSSATNSSKVIQMAVYNALSRGKR
jgi:uncharacterized protein with FMN-binding domain